MIIMMIFNMSTSYFHKISFHFFEDYLNNGIGLRVRKLDKSNITLIHRLDNFSKKNNPQWFYHICKIYNICELVGSLKNKYSPNTNFCKRCASIKKLPSNIIWLSPGYYPYLKPSGYLVQWYPAWAPDPRFSLVWEPDEWELDPEK
jgi:hypothetical protein